MKVSVVMPTYNRAYAIPEALKSVLGQTFEDFELLVIDDGSTDNTAEVVASLSDARIRYIKHQKNAGYPAAINTGLRESRSELISFLDSDDTWKPQKLEADAAFLDSHPEVGAVFCDLEKFDGDAFIGSFIRTTPIFSKLLTCASYPQGIALPQRFMYLCLLQEVPIKPSALTIRRRVFEQIGGFEEAWPSGNDWDFLLRYSRIGRFGYIDQTLSVLRVLKDATHRAEFEKDKQFLMGVLKREACQLVGDPQALSAARAGIAGLTKHLAWFYVAAGRKPDAIAALVRGFRECHDTGLLLRAMALILPGNVAKRMKKYFAKSLPPAASQPPLKI